MKYYFRWWQNYIIFYCIDSLAQDCSSSIANALQLLQSDTNIILLLSE